MSARGVRKCAHCLRKRPVKAVYRAVDGVRWWCKAVYACVEAAKRPRQ